MSESAPRKATADDFWAIPENVRFHELIGGELIEKTAPSGEHGDAQAGVSRPTDVTVKKLRLYHRVGVPHYWLVDPRAETLMVMRWSDAGYVTVLSAEGGEVVRAEPFDAIEIAVGTLFGDDPPA